MSRRKFPSKKAAHERAMKDQLLPSIEPVKKKVVFKVKVIGEDEVYNQPKSSIHRFQFKN